MRQYMVDEARDDTGHLRGVLHRIATEGGRLISVAWQPGRQVTVAGDRNDIPSRYVIIWERDTSDWTAGVREFVRIG